MARTTTMLDGRHDLPKTWTFFLATVLPIGIASSGSLVCSNLAYLHLSVALIQMLKAASPFTVLIAQMLFGLTSPTRAQIINILIIVFGVAIASAGTLDFSFIGFLFQFGGLGFEAVRVVLIEILLSREGLKMDAITGLYYAAPVVAVLNILSAVSYYISMAYREASCQAINQSLPSLKAANFMAKNASKASDMATRAKYVVKVSTLESDSVEQSLEDADDALTASVSRAREDF
ncbi:triose-phosphate transporter [Fusarium coicis]|nr:triose-phosphate transporter [Fusarium coicis]